MKISLFPFTGEAAEMVRTQGPALEELIHGRGYQAVRRRALERVMGSLEGEIPEMRGLSDTFDRAAGMVELLSYPLARILVSCLGEDLLTRRYALAESKLAGRRMRELSAPELVELALDLKLSPVPEGGLFLLHFTDYLPAASRLRSPPWRLVNRPLRSGYTYVTPEELARLLEERARERIIKDLPLPVDAGICRSLEEYLRPLRSGLQVLMDVQMADLGAVRQDAFPPCFQSMLRSLSSGINLSHSARFALTSFLLNVNMSVEQVMSIFATSPDFDEERTRYQVEHIAGSSGTSYHPPSCATMTTYGNCPGPDALCKRVRHPMSYYRKRLREMSRG